MSKENKIKGKIVLTGQIECLSPLHIGSGQDEQSDLDIIRDAEGKPFIPATGLIGVLRHTILEKCFDGKEYPDFKSCWGYTDGDDGRQSSIFCSNLTLEDNDYSILNRDGIRINNKTGIVANNKKFDFELLERGALFNLNVEFTYSANTESYMKKTVRTIYELLLQGYISLGAKTTAGFGKIRLVKESAKLYLFDFKKSRKDIYNWLTRNFTTDNLIKAEDLPAPFPSKMRQFSIIANFSLKNSFIIRSYGSEAELSDATQLKSGKDWVIPGTSIKGAIRARAERIVNTLELKNRCEIMIELFGFIEEDLKRMNCDLPEKFKGLEAKKGKIHIHEIYLEPARYPTELQTRIKIDRFTGGVIEGGLFDSMPVFASEQAEYVTLHMVIEDYRDCEAGLLLLVLKDLWSSDLAIGGEKNIGRGVFRGLQAEIRWNAKFIKIENDIAKLSERQKADLQYFVDALLEEASHES